MAQSSMSSRERMLAALTCQQPDHIPCSPQIQQGPWYRGPLYWRDQFERAEVLMGLGLDPTVEIWLPDVEPHPDVDIKTWRERVEDQVFIVKEYHTPAGVLRQRVHETEDWSSPAHAAWIPTTFGIEIDLDHNLHLFDDYNVSRRTEPWVKGPEDLEKLRYLIRPPSGYRLDEWRMDAERALEFARKHDLLTHARRTIVGDAFQWFCDIPWFILQLYDNPAFVEEFLAIFQQWSLLLIDLATDLGVDLIQYRGWYEIPMYWGFPGFKRFLAPIIEEQTRRMHAGGALASYLLPTGQGTFAEMLSELSFDVLTAVDPRMLERGDLDYLYATLGERKSFWGGVNGEVVLPSQDPDVIDAAVREAITALGKSGGLVLSAVIFALAVPEQSILYMIDSWRKYRDMYK